MCSFPKSDSNGDTEAAEEHLLVNKPLTDLNSLLIQMVSVHMCLCMYVSLCPYVSFLYLYLCMYLLSHCICIYLD